MGQKKLAALALCSAPGLVAAQALEILDCRFESECFETEACAATSYELTLTLTPSGGRTMAVAQSVNETMSGGGFDLAQGGRSFLFQSQMGPVMLTLAADGSARQAVHGGGDAMMINYAGMCEVRG